MALDTPLSRRIGLRHPIVAAPMFLISNKEMVVACAEAGILGSMPTLNARTPEKLRADLEWIRRKTDRPFAMNVTLALSDPERREVDIALLEEFEVPVWLTSYGDPTAAVPRAHAIGAVVMHDVIGARHAKKAASAGVDAIIGVSAGAGGHGGTTSPYVLIPHLHELTGLPIVAAGCISSGRQLVASLALGAELAYVGTRFIASTECGASDAYKDLVVASGVEDIVYTNAVSGVHANFLKSTVPDGTTPDRSPGAAKRWVDIWSAGQGVEQVTSVASIEQIVEDFVREAHDTLAALT
ncbi:MAG: nitronate monooxygenase [Proteobacteria bacterium]|nr:nitronate monooxygenase [Pseudomonadota bacterium]